VLLQSAIVLCCVGIFLNAATGNAKDAGGVTTQDTTQPNQFYFTSDVYYVDEDATSAVIEVGFVPGDRSFSGSVTYYTVNGTAVSGQDYTGVTNTLVFSGPGPSKTFTIPIQIDGLLEGNETVQLFLSNPNANLTRSNATLVIIDKPPRPKLDFIKSNNAVTISWATNFTNFVLQKTTNLPSTNWVNMSPPGNATNGRFNVTTQAVSNAFFRLVSPAP
jgi:hypothetical protein